MITIFMYIITFITFSGIFGMIQKISSTRSHVPYLGTLENLKNK